MRAINKLTPGKVRELEKPGRYADGQGLYLQISRYGTKAWLFRYMLDGRARQMGLGAVDEVTLPDARREALKARALLRDGIDPIDQRNQQKHEARLARAQGITFRDCAGKYIAAHEGTWKNPKHRAQWRSTLETYAYPELGDLPVSAITTPLVLKVLEPIWTEKNETASRLRGRIETILDWAKVREYRDGENPARWKGHLDKSLPRPSLVRKRQRNGVRHHPAVPVDQLPAFMQRLRQRDSVSARALELTILTAARTGETIGATWGEIDFRRKVWTIPAERMKADSEHEVPLPDRAVAILKDLRAEAGEPADDAFIFPGGKPGAGLSNMAMLELLKGMQGMDGYTVHGFRSTFRDWAGDRTSFPRDVIEMALAHTIKNRTEAAYRRGAALEKRRKLMAAWAGFCSSVPLGEEGGSVIEIGARR